MLNRSVQGRQVLLIPLEADEFELLVEREARGLWLRSRLLVGRYATLDKLKADPVAGRVVRMAAVALVRSSLSRTHKTRGR